MKESHNTPLDLWRKRRTQICQHEWLGTHLAVMWTLEDGDQDRLNRCPDRQLLLLSFINTLPTSTMLLFNWAVSLSVSWCTSNDHFYSLDSGQKPQNCQEQVNNKNKITNPSKTQKRKGTYISGFRVWSQRQSKGNYCALLSGIRTKWIM